MPQPMVHGTPDICDIDMGGDQEAITEFPAFSFMLGDNHPHVMNLPFVLLARLFFALGLKKLGNMVPLSAYANKDFYVIRNDSLDRFGTRLEQRFTKEEITVMMQRAGLTDIRFGNDAAFWHAVGRKA